MSHPLEAWKQLYGISDDAHLQLLIILQSYGIGHAPGHRVAYNLQPGIAERPQRGSVQDLPQSSGTVGEASQSLSLIPPGNAPRQGGDRIAGGPRPCVRCYIRKTKCRDRDELICIGCEEANIPRSLCNRVRITETPVFAKWRRHAYEKQLAWDNLSLIGPAYNVDLQHYPQGPTLNVCCAPIGIIDYEQTRLFHKTLEGWASMEATAFALRNPVEAEVLHAYVESHTQLFLDRAQDGPTWLDDLLRHASIHGEDPLVREALYIWTAHRLLMQGWQMTFPGSLGMPLVTDERSLLFGTIPAPRVLQNQLDYRLEQYCAMREERFLKAFSTTMRNQRRSMWDAIFISAVILLHVRERDLHRLLYWTLDMSNTYTWRHPDSARTLIEQSLHASDVLLGHLHFGGGIPTSLTGLVPYMRLEGSAKGRYNWFCEDSIDLSLCGSAFRSDPLRTFKQLSTADFMY